MKYFKLKITALIVLLFSCLVLLSLIVGDSNFLFSQIILVAIAVIIMYSIFSLINQTNKSIAKYLLAVQHLDNSLIFPTTNNNSFDELHAALNESLFKINSLKERQLQQETVFENTLKNAPVGVFIVEVDSTISFSNNYLREVLNIPDNQAINNLSDIDSDLVEFIKSLRYNERKSYKGSGDLDLIVEKVVEPINGNQSSYFVRLATTENYETEAYTKLLSVMAHEIMNSLTVISSLSDGLEKNIQAKNTTDLMRAVASINKRSKALIQFTKQYNSITNVRAAEKSWIQLYSLIEKIIALLNVELTPINVQFSGSYELKIFADKVQMEQVLINLFLNSIKALKNTEKPQIMIEFWQYKSTVVLSFSDNGIGISAGNKNKIFTPFYTTYEDGKGIGLSLCRSLMYKNDASISLKTSEFGNTTFELRWNIV